MIAEPLTGLVVRKPAYGDIQTCCINWAASKSLWRLAVMVNGLERHLMSVSSLHHDNDGNFVGALAWRKLRRLTTEQITGRILWHSRCSEICAKNVVYSVGILYDTKCTTSCNTEICAFRQYSTFMWFSVQAALLSVNSSNWWIFVPDLDFVLCSVYV